MSDSIVAGAQGAVNTLKAAQGAGKQLGSVVSDQQADMEKAVQQQHINRMKAKAEQDYLATLAEFRAYEKYQKQKAHQQKIDQLKQEATKKYGKTAWAEVEATKAKMENLKVRGNKRKNIKLFLPIPQEILMIIYNH